MTAVSIPVTLTAPSVPPIGKPFTIGFDGAVLTGSIAIRSVKEIDRLMRVLQAQKAAFEAMEDEDEEEEPLTEGIATRLPRYGNQRGWFYVFPFALSR